MRPTITFLVANSFLFFSATSSVSQTLPPPPSQDQSDEDPVEYQFEAPSRSSPSSPEPSTPSHDSSNANTLFRVQIYGTSERVLSLVRRVEPKAFVPEGEDIIQAGLFSEQAKANSLVEELANQGVEAEIVPVEESQSRSSSRETISLASSVDKETSNSQSDPTAIDPPSPNAEENVAADTSQAQEKRQTESRDRAYYVVIPSSQEQVSTKAKAVQEAGVTPDLVQQREAPRGTHVAVGPFKNRKEASRWNQQLQTEGLNRARVYFGR